MFSPVGAQVVNSLGIVAFRSHTGILLYGADPEPGEHAFRSHNLDSAWLEANIRGFSYKGPVLGKNFLDNTTHVGEVELTYHHKQWIAVDFSDNLPLIHTGSFTASLNGISALFGLKGNFNKEAGTFHLTTIGGNFLYPVDESPDNITTDRVYGAGHVTSENLVSGKVEFYGVWAAGKQ